MASQISLTIAKILNWTRTDRNARVEVAFYGLSTGSYLAHKSAVGYYNNQSLLLNTSFKIHFTTADHILTCKISLLEQNNQPEVVGSIQIDLKLLQERNLVFIPFQDHDKVLEVKLYEPKKDHADINNSSQLRQHREDFLQQRFDFIDKLNNHESELKKKFTEKVYTFLRELKTRNGYSDPPINEPKRQQDSGKQGKKNELEFRSRFNEQRRRIDTKRMDIFSHPEQPHYRVSPTKQKLDQELLIHSVNAKHDPREGKEPDSWNFVPSKAQKQQKQPHRHQRQLQELQARRANPDFGGVLNNYPY